VEIVIKILMDQTMSFEIVMMKNAMMVILLVVMVATMCVDQRINVETIR
jgi:hypothetical protein